MLYEWLLMFAHVSKSVSFGSTDGEAFTLMPTSTLTQHVLESAWLAVAVVVFFRARLLTRSGSAIPLKFETHEFSAFKRPVLVFVKALVPNKMKLQRYKKSSKHFKELHHHSSLSALHQWFNDHHPSIMNNHQSLTIHYSSITTLQGIPISHLGKRKIIFKCAIFGGYVSSLEGMYLIVINYTLFLVQPKCPWRTNPGLKR